MRHPWEVSAKLKPQIRYLPPDLKCQVRSAVDLIEKDIVAGKPLEEELAGYRSYRIGRYRLIYRLTNNRLILEAFGSRRDIYERFVLELGRQKIRERAARYFAKSRKRKKV